MIQGAFAPGRSPYLAGFVYFPDPIDMTIEVPFLVDTGAEWTTLSQLDLIKLGDKLPQLITTPSPIEVLAASGAGFRQGVALCGVAFVHSNRQVSTFSVRAGVSPTASSIAGIPSLLSMDILSHGDFQLRPAVGSVEFDPPADKLVEVTPPWNREPR